MKYIRVSLPKGRGYKHYVAQKGVREHHVIAECFTDGAAEYIVELLNAAPPREVRAALAPVQRKEAALEAA